MDSVALQGGFCGHFGVFVAVCLAGVFMLYNCLCYTIIIELILFCDCNFDVLTWLIYIEFI